jgi:hypothetical protein
VVIFSLIQLRRFVAASPEGRPGSSTWKKQTDLRYRLLIYKRYLNNENIINS